MKEGKKAPKLRFKGFTDDWEQCKFGGIGTFKGGFGFPENEQGNIDGIPFYKVSDMNDCCNALTMKKASNYVTKSQIIKNNWKPFLNKNIIFAKVGAAVYLERKRKAVGPFLLDNNMMVFQPNNANIDYIYYTFQRLQLSKHVQVGTLPSLNASELENITIFIPSLAEQKVVADFGATIDHTITLHEEKQRQLERLKKALLEKMFRDETGYPILRFKGFNNVWKQRKLGEVSSLRGRIGFRGYKQTDLVEKGKGAITFSPSDIDANGNISFLNNKYISIRKYEESPEIQVNTGDILFTKTASIGKIGYVKKLNEKATINPQIALLTPKIDFNGYFIFLSIRNDAFMRKVQKIVGGSSVPTMSQEKLKNLTINFPSSIEQHKLANIFLKIDGLITLHQHKIDNLKHLKRALLQKMFV